MSNTLINRIIVFIATKLKVSPGVAHILLMCLVTLAFGLANPDGFQVFKEAFFLKIWIGICVLVVMITWLTKGEYRNIWWKAEPWKDG